ncbi:hypothetical protein FACS189479_06790 [Spirochaetia bacterium]|nr:hypothetical protein FACS189479_06790 [Spirochaetia bacterium]
MIDTKNNSIVFFEPVLLGLSHLTFTSSIIGIMSYIFPERDFIFYGSKEHIELTQVEVDKLIGNSRLLKGIYLKNSINKAEKKWYFLKRILFEYKSLVKIRKTNPEYLICLSESPAIVFFSHILFSKTKLIIFFHAGLSIYLKAAVDRKSIDYRKLYYFPLLMKSKNCVNIVLGESIKREAKLILPKAEFESIDHPAQIKLTVPLQADFPLKIGTVGDALISKGSHLFFVLEEKLQRYSENINWYYIGKIVDKEIAIPQNTRIQIHGGNQRLPTEELNYLISILHYGIFFYPSNSYRFGASGAVLDLLTFLKPIIAIRNPYFEYLFGKMGNIGFLCDSLDEMTIAIEDIIGNNDIELYIQQQNNIKNGLKYFSLDYLKNDMIKILDKLQT